MNIIYLGCNGFPNGFAEVQKQKMISKALVASGAKVTVISSKGVFDKKAVNGLSYKGLVEGINYIYTSFVSYKPKSFVLRSLAKVIGNIGEMFAIFKLRNSKDKNVAILSCQNIYSIIYYYYLLKIAGYKTVLSYEEFVSALNIEKNKKGLHVWFDEIVHRYCHAFLPISTFLHDYQDFIMPGKPMFKIPALTDFNKIDQVDAGGKKDNTILFCGASVYYENISFIIDAFDCLNDQEVGLTLVIHGTPAQNKKVFGRIERSARKDRIVTMSNLSTADLFRSYKQARLLLIPLKAYERDIARFPHKISEYTASKTPIVTTAVGEINYYFEDNVTAFIAEDYDVELFASKIDQGLNDPALASQVAENAYQLGLDNFHYKAISAGINDFLHRLCLNRKDSFGTNKLLLKTSLLLNLFLACIFFGPLLFKNQRLFGLHYKVVFFGDSLTENANWPWLLKRMDVKTSGNPGFTTSHLVWLVNDQVLKYKPDTCYIQCGINDIGVGIPFERTCLNYAQILDSLQAHKIVPIVQSTLYTTKTDSTNAKVESLNNHLIKLCADRKISFLDLNKKLSDNDQLIGQFSTDGIHLNKAGYKAWITALHTKQKFYD